MTQSTPLRLVVFDVDGTLVDSQGQILRAMRTAFEDVGVAQPDRAAVRSIIGLSLPDAMALLAPTASDADRLRLVSGYKEAFAALRVAGGAEAASPLYPGARAALDALAEIDTLLLGVATGKSRRGLEHLLEAHNLRRFFVTTQVADDHPSKPHPSMLWQALSETGVAAGNAVMLGDTEFDMNMAGAAGVSALGVGWGYHPPDALRASGARDVLAGFADLSPALDTIWRQA